MSTNRHVPTYPLCDDTCTTDCGHCKGNHDLTRTAADQTPATDSERDQRPTYEQVMDAYGAHRRAGQEMHAALLDIWRMADPEGRKRLTFQDPSDVLASTRALLSEQAATIERVRAVHRPEWMYALADKCGHPDDDVHDTIEADSGDLLCMITRAGEACADCRDEDGSRVDYPCATIRALGSQRTEGDRD